MSCETFQKDVDGKRRVIVDYSDWLGSSQIASVSWTVPSGITESGSTNSTTTATNYFEGGTDGQDYTIKCCATTNDSPTRIKCVSFRIEIRSSCE